MKTQDLSDIDTSLSNTPTSDSDQSEASAASASYVQVTQTTTEADTSRSSEECVKPRNKPSDLTCGQCDMHYEGTGAYDKLKEHYLDKLQRMDGKHTAFLSKGKFDKFSVCTECDDDRQFSNAHALLQHIVAKAKVVCKSQREHFNDLDCIAQMFVDRDAGNDTEKDFISFLCDYLTALGDESDDAFEGLYKDDINLISKDFDLMKPFAGKSETYCDSDDDGIFGFSEDDVFELMCQGIKPWDPEAGAALAILNGDDW